jgi:AcrR family transcriptional regulator
MVIEKRARSREQKIERRQHIMAAAAELIGDKRFHTISMADVARQAGMAKGTVFLYFKTKEALFMAITAQQFETWFDAMDRTLGPMARSKNKTTNQTLLKDLQPVFQAHPLLPKLVAIMHIVLEQNIDYTEARTFKRMLCDRLQNTGALLEGCLSHLKAGQGAKFLVWMSALVIGLTHMAEPAPVIKELYCREPDLQMFQVDFGADFFGALETILDGWQAQNRRKKK